MNEQYIMEKTPAAKILTTLAVAVLICFSLSSLAAPANDGKVLLQARYQSTGNQLQQFVGNVTIADTDADKPLTLTFMNGPDQSPKFNWVRVFLSDESDRSAGAANKPIQANGRMILNENSFKSTNKVVLPLAGLVRAGRTSRLIITGAGFKGATISWSITTPPVGAMQITSTAPSTARGGGALTINGAGFAPTAAGNAVYFNQTKAKVTQANATALQVEVPSNLVPGKYTIQVAVNGGKCEPFPIVVAGAPELIRTDWQGGPCGTTVRIYGKNFSENAEENTVYFDKAKATVSNATADTLTVIVPQFPELDGSTYFITPKTLDITVNVGTTPAKGHLGFTSARVGWQQ